MTLRRGTWIAGALLVVCVAILLLDYAVATTRAPHDDQIVKDLQQQVQTDATMAVKLAGEQHRITVARRARKVRDGAIAWALLVTSAFFLVLTKRTVGQASRPVPNPKPRLASVRLAARKARSQVLPPAALDLDFVDRLVSGKGRTAESAIELLQAIQNHYRYLPDEALRRLCDLTGITPAQIAGTSSFYGQFRRAPVGKHLVRVCHGTACHVAGARQITEELRRYLGIPEGSDTDAARTFTVGEVACLGCCSLAPVLMVDGHTAGRLTPSTAGGALAPFEEIETA